MLTPKEINHEIKTERYVVLPASDNDVKEFVCFWMGS